MNKIIAICMLCMFSFTVVSCANNEDAGVITGAVAGGLLGSTIGQGAGQAIAIAAGTMAGAFIGGNIGRSMDAADRAEMNAALENNPRGVPAYWRNAHSRTYYEVIPERDVEMDGYEYCREYRTVAKIEGRKQVMRGTACRQPNGTWRAVS